MKTACLFAALAATGAVAPPRISVALDGQAVAGSGFGKLGSTYDKVCKAGAATPKNCPYPQASAYDHHDKEVKVQQQVWKMVNNGEPVLVCDSEVKGKACDSSIVDYSKPAEYLFLYNSEDKSGNKAVESGKAARMEGAKSGSFKSASVTFNLILEDEEKPTICYNQVYSAADLKRNGALFCSDNGFKSDDDKIFTVQGAADAPKFLLKNSLVHDDITYPPQMNIKYTVASCPRNTNDATAIEAGTCTGLQKEFQAKDLTVPTAVQDYIQTFISGENRDVGYVAIRMDAHDTAGIYGKNNQNNAAKPLIVAVKVVDTAAPAIAIEGAAQMPPAECGSASVFPVYKDAGATYTEKLDRCTTFPCKPGVGPKGFLEGACVAGKSGYCHYTNNFAEGKCAPQYAGKQCAAGRVAGDFFINYVATDLDKNTETKIRTVSIVDKTAPVLTLKVKGTNGVVYECDHSKAQDCDVQYKSKQAHSDNTIEQFDAGFVVSDACDEHISAAQVSKSWGAIEFDRKTLGAYVRTYTATDAAGNRATAYRTFHVVDEEIPRITMAGDAIQTVNANRDTEYYDAGATCEDFVDGVLNHRVKVSGDIVDYTVVGTYKVHYDCEDLSGYKAFPATRTIVVQDVTAPEIRLVGKSSVTVESGFPYHEEGATATDTLDGEITYCSEEQNQIVTGDTTVKGSKPVLKNKNCLRVTGNSVNTYFEYNSRESCRDIYAASKGTAQSGKYTITVRVGGKLKKVNAFCNMESATQQFTYVFKHGGSSNQAMRNRICQSTFGLRALRTSDNIDRSFFEALQITQQNNAAAYLPVAGKAFGYFCTSNDVDAAPQTLDGVDCNEADAAHRCTRFGTYFIKYTTSDLRGNVAEPKIRTVKVVDTLPPVISLHFRAKTGLAQENSVSRKASDMPNYPRHEYVIQTSEGGVSSADDHEANPSTQPAYNPNLNNADFYPVQGSPGGINRGLMAEAATSVNAWLVAAAASAVAGVALLAASSKKTVTSVPV